MAESEIEGSGSIPNKEGTFGKEVAREKIHQGVYHLITICLHMAWKWWNCLRCFWPAQPCGQQRERPSNEAKSYHPPVSRNNGSKKMMLVLDQWLWSGHYLGMNEYYVIFFSHDSMEGLVGRVDKADRLPDDDVARHCAQDWSWRRHFQEKYWESEEVYSHKSWPSSLERF